jgi:membrane-associated phospholipid phosphatase
LRVHWLFDVIGGAVGGAAVVMIVLGLIARRTRRPA